MLADCSNSGVGVLSAAGREAVWEVWASPWQAVAQLQEGLGRPDVALTTSQGQ